MPLDHAHMTPAERITLRLYPIVYAVLGVIFLAQPPSRTSSPSFDAAKLIWQWLPSVGPMRVWGIVFLSIALVELYALGVRHDRRLYIRALEAGAGLAAFWLVLALASAADSTIASFSGACWVGLAVGAQMASARMLASRGTTA